MAKKKTENVTFCEAQKRKNAKRIYVKPIQAATKRAIAVGMDRARQQIIEKTFSQSTLLSVALGYEIYGYMKNRFDLEPEELKLLMLIGSYHHFPKNNAGYYGFEINFARRTFDKLEKRKLIQMILRMPHTYALTLKGTEKMKRWADEYDKMISELKKGVDRKSRIFVNYNKQEDEDEKRKKEIDLMFKVPKLGRTK